VAKTIFFFYSVPWHIPTASSLWQHEVVLILLLFVCSTVIASNLLLVDEIMRAGLSSLKG